jgi:hypothetical protein
MRGNVIQVIDRLYLLNKHLGLNNHYIKLNFSNWEADRTYKIEFMIEQDVGSQYFDDNITFSITKN